MTLVILCFLSPTFAKIGKKGGDNAWIYKCQRSRDLSQYRKNLREKPRTWGNERFDGMM